VNELTVTKHNVVGTHKINVVFLLTGGQCPWTRVATYLIMSKSLRIACPSNCFWNTVNE